LDYLVGSDCIPQKKHGRGRGFGPRRHGLRRRGLRAGRPRVQPAIEMDFSTITGQVPLQLSPFELEALRLADEENLIQEEAATRMNISRGSFWRILTAARRKVITALLAGKEINVTISDESSSLDEE
jgi:predicted DNA-binding protein (UPF0251 family)